MMPTAKAYIVDLNSLEKFEFDFNPEITGDDKDSEYGSDQIPGASNIRVSFGNGGNRVLSLNIRLVRLDAAQPVDYVKTQAEWIQSLQSPEDENDYDQRQPPFCQFIYGELYDLPVIIKKVGVVWGIHRNEDGLPEYADLKVTMWEVSEETIVTSDVRTNHFSNVRYLQGHQPGAK